jgi:hypothetical protein
MLRGGIHGAAAVAFVLLQLLVQDISAESPTAPTAESVLTRAADLVDLSGTGGAGFMLLAKVQLQDGGKSTEGVYALAWAPGRYRRVFRFPNYAETDIVGDDTIYRQRSTEAPPLLVWELDRLVDISESLQPHLASKLSLLADHADRTCVRSQLELSESKICVDLASGELQSIEDGINVVNPGLLRERFEFSDYQPFGTKKFPRKLTFRGWDSRSIDVRIEKLFKVDSFPAGEFKPTGGAERMHYCENPQISGDVRPNTGNAIPIGLHDTEVDMYFQVTPVGGVRYAQVVYSDNPLVNKEVLNWFIGTHFPIRSCSGQAIAYETIIRLLFGR